MLEKLFTSRARIKILNYLFFDNSESSIREMSRKLSLSSSIVKNETDNLKKIGLIHNGKKILLNKNCPFFNDLRNIFIKTDFLKYPILNCLKGVSVKYAFIFGSFAQGNYTPESDIDLMIIGEVKREEIYSLLKKTESHLGREINPVVWTLEELKKKKEIGFLRDILKKKIIMIIGDENEFRKVAG